MHCRFLLYNGVPQRGILRGRYTAIVVLSKRLFRAYTRFVSPITIIIVSQSMNEILLK